MSERERETIWYHNLSLENLYEEFKTSSGFFVLSSSQLRYVGFPPIIGKAITSGTLKVNEKMKYHVQVIRRKKDKKRVQRYLSASQL